MVVIVVEDRGWWRHKGYVKVGGVDGLCRYTSQRIVRGGRCGAAVGGVELEVTGSVTQGIGLPAELAMVVLALWGMVSR